MYVASECKSAWQFQFHKCVSPKMFLCFSQTMERERPNNQLLFLHIHKLKSNLFMQMFPEWTANTHTLHGPHIQDQHLPNLLAWHSLRHREGGFSSNCHLIKREISMPQGSGWTLNIIIFLPGTLGCLFSCRSFIFGCSHAWSPHLSVWLIIQISHIEMAAIHQDNSGRVVH